MGRFRLTKTVGEIDTGHRLLNHCGKCASPHGHRYTVQVVVEGEVLDDVGVVLDFTTIKSGLHRWLEEHWDHTMILQEGDPLIGAMYGNYRLLMPNVLQQVSPLLSQPFGLSSGYRVIPNQESPTNGRVREDGAVIGRPGYILPYAPSAENLARYLMEVVVPVVLPNTEQWRVVGVTIFETPSSSVTYTTSP